MKDKYFSVIDNPENNFIKNANVISDLLWGDYPKKEIYLSVIIITYKRPELVKEAIQSVCCQKQVSYEWEIVVIDNNPQEEEVYKYISKLENSRIRYYRNKKNIGHEGNVNRGIELATGKWVALLHDDDLVTADYLLLIEKYIKACSKWKRPLAYIRTKHLQFINRNELPVYPTNRKIESKFYIRRELWLETLFNGYGPTFVNSCGSLILKSAFMEIGGYNEKLNPIGDSTLGLILMKHGYSVYTTELVLGFYRQGQNLSVKKETLLSLIEADYYLREYLYSKNCLTRIFGKTFRNVQFAEAVDIKLSYAKKYQHDNPHEIPSIEEINEIHIYKHNKFLKELLRTLRRMMVLLYRQSHIRWRRK